jgi:hypothetical protein
MRTVRTVYSDRIYGPYGLYGHSYRMTVYRTRQPRTKPAVSRRRQPTIPRRSSSPITARTVEHTVSSVWDPGAAAQSASSAITVDYSRLQSITVDYSIKDLFVQCILVEYTQ